MPPPPPDDTSRQIRARIHDNALKRVTRMYSASLEDTLIELLQNSRRAGATRVTVHITSRTPTTATVAVRDDGDGIVDPNLLLSFGENGWDETLVHREDAAGMGLLSLARKHSIVASRPRTAEGSSAPGWRVELSPDHFLGKIPATVQPDKTAPLPHGTSIAFDVNTPAHAGIIPAALRQAALHYPLPVTLVNHDCTPSERKEMERKAFLDGAMHVEHWHGLVLGVFTNRSYAYGLHAPNLNFHGLTLSIKLPRAHSVNGTIWSVVADVVDCPELELVLPSRKEAVQTPFLETLHEAATHAIYRAMATHPDPRPAYKTWIQAREAGIHIPIPPAELRPWRPAIADLDSRPADPDLSPLPDNALVVTCEGESPDDITLWHAARKAGIDARLFEPHHAFEGFHWFDALDRVQAIETQITRDKKSYALEDYPIPERPRTREAWLPERPDTIFLRLCVQSSDGSQRVINLATDLCFAGNDESWIHDALPVVTRESRLTPDQLAELLAQAFYAPSDDYAESGSPEQQQQDFDEVALHLATTLLVSERDAIRTTIADIVARDLLWRIPNRKADIRIRDRSITVTFGSPDTEPQTV